MNARLRELYPQSEELFDIVLVTYNHAHVGIRLINTINHHSEFHRENVKLHVQKRSRSLFMSVLNASVITFDSTTFIYLYIHFMYE